MVLKVQQFLLQTKCSLKMALVAAVDAAAAAAAVDDAAVDDAAAVDEDADAVDDAAVVVSALQGVGSRETVVVQTADDDSHLLVGIAPATSRILAMAMPFPPKTGLVCL